MTPACSVPNKSGDPAGASSESGSSVVVTSGGASGERTIFIPTTFTKSKVLPPVAALRSPDASPAGFSLTASATTFTIQMTSCLSGYTASVTQANLDGLEVYKHDRGCLAKLTGFTYGGRSYIPTAGDPFTTWQVGDVARFDEAGEPGTHALYVAVMSTLGSPISGTESISYVFSEFLAGDDKGILWVTEGATGNYVASVPTASSFSIRSTELTGLTAGEGGEFRFVLECASSIGVTNVCESYDFTATDYKLIEDTYSSAPTEGNLAGEFGAAGTSITLPDDRVAPGNLGTANGGFITVVLDGPDDMASNPNMLIIIREGSSYHYLNVDVVTSTTY